MGLCAKLPGESDAFRSVGDKHAGLSGGSRKWSSATGWFTEHEPTLRLYLDIIYFWGKVLRQSSESFLESEMFEISLMCRLSWFNCRTSYLPSITRNEKHLYRSLFLPWSRLPVMLLFTTTRCIYFSLIRLPGRPQRSDDRR